MKKGDKVTIHGVIEKFPGKILEVNEERAEVHVWFIEVDGSRQTAWLPIRNVTPRK